MFWSRDWHDSSRWRGGISQRGFELPHSKGGILLPPHTAMYGKQLRKLGESLQETLC